MGLIVRTEIPRGSPRCLGYHWLDGPPAAAHRRQHTCLRVELGAVSSRPSPPRRGGWSTARPRSRRGDTNLPSIHGHCRPDRALRRATPRQAANQPGVTAAQMPTCNGARRARSRAWRESNITPTRAAALKSVEQCCRGGARRPAGAEEDGRLRRTAERRRRARLRRGSARIGADRRTRRRVRFEPRAETRVNSAHNRYVL